MPDEIGIDLCDVCLKAECHCGDAHDLYRDNKLTMLDGEDGDDFDPEGNEPGESYY